MNCCTRRATVSGDPISWPSKNRWRIVRTRASEPRVSSMLEQQAAWQDGEVVALAEVTMVYVKDGRTAPIPDAMRAGLRMLQP